MESGHITDDQITASSSFGDGRWAARQARLNYDENAWTPADDTNKEYIQVSTKNPEGQNPACVDSSAPAHLGNL